MKKLRKEKRRRKSISILLALCLAAGLPATALAATIADNPTGVTVNEIAAEDIMHNNNGTVTTNKGYMGKNYGTVTTNDGEIGDNYDIVTTHNGVMSYNNGTIDTNNGEVLENQARGVITTNEANGIVTNNYGKITTNEGNVGYNNAGGEIATNSGTVEYNYGDITSNTGTVKYNMGGTVNGGTVTNNYKYKITNTATDENVSFYSGNEDVGAVNVADDGTVYIKDDASVIIAAMPGYKISGTPQITSGGGTISDNGDGTYTLASVTGDVTITVTTVYIPVTDILGIPDSITAGTDIYLDDVVTVTPEGANDYIRWEVIDAGTTGAAIDHSFGVLTTTATGTMKIRATIENGKSETEDFVKEFTINVYDDALAMLNDSAPSGNTNDDNTTSANTGDDSNMLPWIIMAAASIIVGAGTLASRRRI